MKAAVVTRYGPPEVVEVRDVPPPVPAGDEVVVRVHASTVSFGDRMLRSGPLLVRLLNGLAKPKQPILGVDFSGTVEAVGGAVTRFAPGDEVFGSRGGRFGAHAELVCVAENGFLARKPRNMSFDEAATLFVGAACPLFFLRKARLRAGDEVLVHGASGSLGVFAVQLAKHFGARVTGVCGPTNGELVRQLGADAVIDYTTRDFTAGGAIYDVIVDVLGKAGFPRSLRALKPGGRYLLIGFSGGLLSIIGCMLAGAWAHVRGIAKFTAGAAAPVPADLELLRELVEAGELRTVIGGSYALEHIVDAYRHADTGHKIGNIVVRIPS
jgi:NADPH:quinone reductase-like Zn-dependent oxidoreductase